jgi:hypothetical protein
MSQKTESVLEIKDEHKHKQGQEPVLEIKDEHKHKPKPKSKPIKNIEFFINFVLLILSIINIVILLQYYNKLKNEKKYDYLLYVAIANILVIVILFIYLLYIYIYNILGLGIYYIITILALIFFITTSIIINDIRKHTRLYNAYIINAYSITTMISFILITIYGLFKSPFYFNSYTFSAMITDILNSIGE